MTIAVVACVAMSLHHLGCSPSDPPAGSVDTDGDGLTDAEELNVYGTSPILADTDGDGFSDGDEVVKLGFDPANNPYMFNPRVADVPQLAVALVGPPIVTVQTTDDHGVTHTIESSRSDGVTDTQTVGRTDSSGRSDTLSTSTTDTAERSDSVTFPGTSVTTTFSGGGAEDAGGGADAGEVDAGADATVDAGAPEAAADSSAQAQAAAPQTSVTSSSPSTTITLTDSVSTTVNPSTTFDTSIALSQEQQRQYAVLLTQTESLASSATVTRIGGFLKIAAIIQNRSHLAYRVTDVVIGAALVDASGALFAIENLIFDQGILSAFVPFSLSPGEAVGPVTFATNVLTLQTTEALLANTRELDLRLAAYELVDATGKPFEFNDTEIGARTALVVIDYGHARSPEVYQVATNLDPARPGITTAKAFGEILRIPYVADKVTGLTSVRTVGTDDASGAPRWNVEHVHYDGVDLVDVPYGTDGEPYDFDGIELHAGDVLHVVLLAPGAPPPTAPPQGLGVGPSDSDGGFKVTSP